MATSQNGWPASSNKAAIGIVGLTVAGVSFPQGVKSGDVATVLGYVAEQFHRRVEPLTAGWCWGYAYRTIEGSSQLSNHASGTAIDINAPRHPMGRKGTFTAAQVREIERILAEVAPAVRWGGHYSGRVDEMHFEINANAATVAAVATRLRGAKSPAPAPAPAPVGDDWTEDLIMALPTLRRGSTGGAVRNLQGLLLAHRSPIAEEDGKRFVDGVFGPRTEQAVERFQRAYGLAIDGIVGRQTWTKLIVR